MSHYNKPLFFVVDPAGIEPTGPGSLARPGDHTQRIHVTRPSYPGAGNFFVTISLSCNN